MFIVIRIGFLVLNSNYNKLLGSFFFIIKKAMVLACFTLREKFRQFIGLIDHPRSMFVEIIFVSHASV